MPSSVTGYAASGSKKRVLRRPPRVTIDGSEPVSRRKSDHGWAFSEARTIGFMRRKKRFCSLEPRGAAGSRRPREDPLLDVLEPPVELLHEMGAEDAVQPVDAEGGRFERERAVRQDADGHVA